MGGRYQNDPSLIQQTIADFNNQMFDSDDLGVVELDDEDGTKFNVSKEVVCYVSDPMRIAFTGSTGIKVFNINFSTVKRDLNIYIVCVSIFILILIYIILFRITVNMKCLVTHQMKFINS